MLRAGVGKVRSQQVGILQLLLTVYFNFASAILESAKTGHCCSQSHCVPTAVFGISHVLHVLVVSVECLWALALFVIKDRFLSNAILLN